jgi:hypothetical protein
MAFPALNFCMHMADYIAIWLFNRMHALGGSEGFA